MQQVVLLFAAAVLLQCQQLCAGLDDAGNARAEQSVEFNRFNSAASQSVQFVQNSSQPGEQQLLEQEQKRQLKRLATARKHSKWLREQHKMSTAGPQHEDYVMLLHDEKAMAKLEAQARAEVMADFISEHGDSIREAKRHLMVATDPHYGKHTDLHTQLHEAEKKRKRRSTDSGSSDSSKSHEQVEAEWRELLDIEISGDKVRRDGKSKSTNWQTWSSWADSKRMREMEAEHDAVLKELSEFLRKEASINMAGLNHRQAEVLLKFNKRLADINYLLQSLNAVSKDPLGFGGFKDTYSEQLQADEDRLIREYYSSFEIGGKNVKEMLAKAKAAVRDAKLHQQKWTRRLQQMQKYAYFNTDD